VPTDIQAKLVLAERVGSASIACTLAAVLGALGCSRGPRVPPEELVIPYSYELEETQPARPPFLAHFEKDRRSLWYVASVHGCDAETFRLVDAVLSEHRVRSVIIEGYPALKGTNPPDFTRHFQEWAAKGFCEGGGEPAYTAAHAMDHGAPFVGGEPDEPAVVRAVLERGFSADDLLGYYVVRQLPQFRREGRLEGEGFEPSFRHFVSAMGEKAGLGDVTRFTPDRFREWYAAKQGKAFDLATFEDREADPVTTGPYTTQKMGAIVGVERDRFIVQSIARHLAADLDVLVVYGGSHYPTQLPALESLVGRPIVPIPARP
jgi:hypothetical protein